VGGGGGGVFFNFRLGAGGFFQSKKEAHG
jgi:hypothetical protein